MKIQCEAVSIGRQPSGFPGTVKKSGELMTNQSNLLQKINKYKSEQKAGLNFQEFVNERWEDRGSRISEYKINPHLNKLRQFNKQELFDLRESYYKIFKRDNSITTQVESPHKIVTETIGHYLPSIEIMKKITSSRIQKIDILESGKSTKESSRTFSGKLSINSCAKTIVLKMQSQRERYSTKKEIRSSSVKARRGKKEKKEVELGFKDLIALETFSVSPISQSLSKDPEILKIKAKSVTILSQNQFLFSLNPGVEREIASLTKIMTCYVSLILIRIHQINMKTTVKVSRTAAQLGGTTAGLRSGDLISYEDLLYGVMLPSGNDAAFTLAEHIGKIIYMKGPEYHKIKEQAKQKLKSKIILTEEDCQKRFSPSTHKSIECFIKKMNQLAEYLNLTRTSFSNTHGLSDINNKSTSRDISVLCHYALKEAGFRRVVKTKCHSCCIHNQYSKLSRDVEWENTNRLLESGECTGIKTGVTGSAGPCMAGSFIRKGREYIIVILRTTCLSSRFSEVRMLLELGYKYIRREQLMEQERVKRQEQGVEREK